MRTPPRAGTAPGGGPAGIRCAAPAASTLFFAVVNGLALVVVLQRELGPGIDVLPARLTLLPWSGAMAVASWIAGTRLVPRYGSRVMFAGLTALLLGTVFLHGAAPGTPLSGDAALNGARHAFWWAIALVVATGGAAAFLAAPAGRERAKRSGRGGRRGWDD
ncbi:hypothetical protein [Streptomyces sp. NPDC053427]|uniref:hypothetical protein n=1 Tax=Streptomyces sp. NPDC053427 TaxID=3365701 RepID=UPI0037D59297